MPEIPRLQPGRVIPLQRVAPQDVGSGAGSLAMGDAAGTAAYAASRIQEAEQAANVASGVYAVDEQLAKLEVDLAENEPDHGKWEEKYAKARTTLLGEFRKKITGAQFQQAFDLRAGNMADRRALGVRQAVLGRRLNVAKAGALTSSDEWYRKASETADPIKRQSYTDEGDAALAAAEATGAMSPVEVADHKMRQGDALRAADARRAQAGVIEQIRRDPAQAYRDLNDPDSELSSGLDEYQRQVAIGQAASEHAQGLAAGRAQYEFEQRQMDKAEADFAAEAQKLADEALDSGDMGRLDQILDESRDAMTPEQRRYYLKRKAAGGGLENKGASTDPDTYSDLWARGARGEPIMADADREFRAGRISLSDRNALIKDSDDRRFGAAEKYLEERLRVGEAVDNMTGRALKADALASFAQWKARNPEATPEEAQDKARDLGDRHSIVEFEKIESATPAPPFAVGDRTAGFDLDATEDAILAEFGRRRGLTGAETPEQAAAALSADPEYREALTLVDRWREFQARKATKPQVNRGN